MRGFGGILALIAAAATVGWPPPAAGEVAARGAGGRPGGAGAALVVVDPGHGGTNVGAPGAVAGVYEKQVTLALARQLATALRARGLRVELTRDDDRYLSLRERGRRANRLGADVFVSVHVNASAAHAQRGFETFILSPRALDVDGRALRAADGPPRRGVAPEVAELLDDLERGEAMAGSAELAIAIQRALGPLRGTNYDRGVRQATHHVLLGLTMPAVLIEVGFIDHPTEGRELLEPAMQLRIAEAMAAAIASQLLPKRDLQTNNR